MNNLRNLLFSSYQRTTMIILLAVLAIAIPITLTLVGQQQDIRQRAAEEEVSDIASRNSISIKRCDKDDRGDCPTGFSCSASGGRDEGICLPSDIAVAPIPSCLPKLPCFDSGTCRDLKSFYESLTRAWRIPWCPSGVTPICIPRPACLDKEPKCLLPETGWCPVTPTKTPTATTAPTSSPSATSTPTTTPTLIPQPEFHDVIDFNDDGKIEEIDLNILLKSFERRFGD